MLERLCLLVHVECVDGWDTGKAATFGIQPILSPSPSLDVLLIFPHTTTHIKSRVELPDQAGLSTQMSSAMSLRQLARPARQIRSYGRRYNSSTPSSSSSSSTTSSIAKNPQVQRAMDSAQKLASSSAATVQRVAGPLGDRVGSALGSESLIPMSPSFTT